MPFLWALAAVRLHPGLPVCWAALRCAGCLCCWGGGGWGWARVWHTQVSREGGRRPLQVSVMEMHKAQGDAAPPRVHACSIPFLSSSRSRRRKKEVNSPFALPPPPS